MFSNKSNAAYLRKVHQTLRAKHFCFSNHFIFFAAAPRHCMPRPHRRVQPWIFMCNTCYTYDKWDVGSGQDKSIAVAVATATSFVAQAMARA